jgi:hypothetical protein
MWRKFLPDERDLADTVLNETSMRMIAAREYELAEKLLRFGIGLKQHSSDRIKRMMTVNLANAAKLNGDKSSCEKYLLSNDWTATSYHFQICVAAVRNNFQEVERLMKLGSNVIEITASDFRDWPVFIDARKDARLKVVFEEVYGEALTKEDPEVLVVNTNDVDGQEPDLSQNKKVVH